MCYFAEMPMEEAVAVEATLLVIEELHRICAENGVQLIFAYIPPLWDTQLERYDPEHPEVVSTLGLVFEGNSGAGRIFDQLRDQLTAFDVPVLDLQPVFREHTYLMYWKRDHHINVAAHFEVARSLLPLIEGVWERGEVEGVEELEESGEPEAR